MNKVLLLALIASFGMTNVSAKSVYTCVINGKTVYQGNPCAGSKELNDQVKAAQASHKQAEINAAKQRVEWNSRKEPRVGMTKSQIENSTWGHPSRYNELQTAGGLTEFWHYHSGRMIHFRNGVVVSITQ